MFRKNKIVLTRTLLWGGIFVFTAACGPKKPFSGPRELGEGNWVSAESLNHGWEVYNNYCMSCHGMNGDGKGPAAYGAFPPPRNFQQGLFKFGRVEAGELPTDDDLKRIIRYGLRGTPMLPWDMSDKQLHDVIQYMKTFAPEKWTKGKAGNPVAMSEDPWGESRKAEAILHGKKVYHGVAQCWSCHPSFATLSEVDADARELSGSGVTELRENPDISLPADSEYNAKFMPPDFTKHWIKTGYEVSSIYQLLSVGVNGTSMPAWKGNLSPSGDATESDKNQWALAYYLQSLQELKYDSAARKAFIDDLNRRRAEESNRAQSARKSNDQESRAAGVNAR